MKLVMGHLKDRDIHTQGIADEALRFVEGSTQGYEYGSSLIVGETYLITQEVLFAKLPRHRSPIGACSSPR